LYLPKKLAVYRFPVSPGKMQKVVAIAAKQKKDLKIRE
jgi:hypothetical protein